MASEPCLMLRIPHAVERTDSLKWTKGTQKAVGIEGRNWIMRLAIISVTQSRPISKQITRVRT